MRNIRLYLLLFIILGFTKVSSAQSSATEYALATTIIKPISIENSRDLSFGNILSSSSAGTVVITPAGARSRSGGATFIPSLPGIFSSAEFTVYGQANAAFTITVPANNTVVLTKSGGIDMKVRAFKHSLTSTSSRKIGSGGSKVFTVGATLNVNAKQNPGMYTGTFNVTVAYN